MFFTIDTNETLVNESRDKNIKNRQNLTDNHLIIVLNLTIDVVNVIVIPVNVKIGDVPDENER